MFNFEVKFVVMNTIRAYFGLNALTPVRTRFTGHYSFGFPIENGLYKEEIANASFNM